MALLSYRVTLLAARPAKQDALANIVVDAYRLDTSALVTFGSTNRHGTVVFNELAHECRFEPRTALPVIVEVARQDLTLEDFDFATSLINAIGTTYTVLLSRVATIPAEWSGSLSKIVASAWAMWRSDDIALLAVAQFRIRINGGAISSIAPQDTSFNGLAPSVTPVSFVFTGLAAGSYTIDFEGKSLAASPAIDVLDRGLIVEITP